MTTFLILLAASTGPYAVYKAVRLPLLELIPICALFTLFLLLNNLSLTTNPVGFYQLAKILTTPALVVLDFVIFGKTITIFRLVAVLISCVGVALTNGATAWSNPLGAAIAIAAFVVTALYQIWIGKKIKDLNVTGAQLLVNQSLVAIMMLLPLVPFFDTVPDLRESICSDSDLRTAADRMCRNDSYASHLGLYWIRPRCKHDQSIAISNHRRHFALDCKLRLPSKHTPNG